MSSSREDRMWFEQIKALTEGRAPTTVFEAAGHAKTFRLAVEAARPRRASGVLGKINVNEEVELSLGIAHGGTAHRAVELRRCRPRLILPWLAREVPGQERLKLDED